MIVTITSHFFILTFSFETNVHEKKKSPMGHNKFVFSERNQKKQRTFVDQVHSNTHFDPILENDELIEGILSDSDLKILSSLYEDG